MTNDREPVLTDLDLALLVFHGKLAQCPSADEVADSRERLRHLGLLHEREDDEDEDEVPLTDRGEAHLEYLLTTGLPQRRRVWVHE